MTYHRPDLYEQFVHMQWLLHRYQLQNYREFGPFADPHRGQGRVLALLKLNPEISQKDLSNILNIRSQSLGELLFKLERNGYITRTPSESDRRVIMIRLTSAGKAAANQSEPKSDGDRVFGCLSEDERAALSGYFSRIICSLEKQFADFDAHGAAPKGWFGFGEGGPGFNVPEFGSGFGFGGYGWKPKGFEGPEDED
jgi:DNA-binding MarR family transcriptional regulator